jgi:TetR/AcrR family tetracycline transcriptional repressor
MALDRELVVRTALAQLDELGLNGLTLRRIASALDVQAPALYWHFKSKQELLDEMATTMLRDLIAEGGLPDTDLPWPDYLAQTGRVLRRMLLAHRDGAKVFSGTYLTDDALLAAQEEPLRVLTAAGCSLPAAVAALHTIYSYTIGFTIEQQAVFATTGERDERYEPSRRARRIDADAHPHAHTAGEELFTQPDERFERGLSLIVLGVAEQLRRTRGTEP